MNAMPQRKSCGLTLIEVLVAVAILGMVVAAIYSTWTSILRATRVARKIEVHVE